MDHGRTTVEDLKVMKRGTTRTGPKDFLSDEVKEVQYTLKRDLWYPF